jgi:hypothetical protein
MDSSLKLFKSINFVGWTLSECKNDSISVCGEILTIDIDDGRIVITCSSKDDDDGRRSITLDTKCWRVRVDSKLFLSLRRRHDKKSRDGIFYRLSAEGQG